jgi:hypothetical protein
VAPCPAVQHDNADAVAAITDYVAELDAAEDEDDRNNILSDGLLTHTKQRGAHFSSLRAVVGSVAVVLALSGYAWGVSGSIQNREGLAPVHRRGYRQSARHSCC